MFAGVHLAKGSSRAWTLLEEQHGVGWVTAGKLLARKRPRLLPVYDRVVRCVLGKPDVVWSALDEALADPGVQSSIARLRQAAAQNVSALRTVDVAVWMRHHSEHARSACADFGPE